MSAGYKRHGKHRKLRIRPAALVIAAVVLLGVFGVLIGLRSGERKREALEADRKSQMEQAAEEEAAALAAEEAAREAEEERLAAEEAEKARDAERERTKALLESQAKQANSEDAEIIKNVASLGIPDVGLYAAETAVVPEEIELGHLICIDPTSTGDSSVNLTIALKLQGVLESRGYRVVMTRTSTESEPGGLERAGIAQGSGCEIMVSIQTNAAEDPGLMGCTAYGAAPGAEGLSEDTVARSQSLCNLTAAHISASTGCANRGYEAAASLNGSNWTTLPWAIVSAGFVSSPAEAANLAQDDYQNRVAAGIANGIDAYFAG